MRLLLKYLLFILLPAYTYGQSGRPDAGITFEVTDSLHNPLAYATVAHGAKSGLADAAAILKDVVGISFVRFDATDIVRHPLVGAIVRAYDAVKKKGE